MYGHFGDRLPIALDALGAEGISHRSRDEAGASMSEAGRMFDAGRGGGFHIEVLGVIPGPASVTSLIVMDSPEDERA